ncbi:hypothetical protein PI172_2252 [Prevotella intermedia]|uniref:Uncharacterized protein n=1 Tax=Prevotella intermedia TaxID=28131 RepID=A0AAD1F872_PREIN|nr:hypothetical protein PI172_2252 [Prevotella intermedia]
MPYWAFPNMAIKSNRNVKRIRFILFRSSKGAFSRRGNAQTRLPLHNLTWRKRLF